MNEMETLFVVLLSIFIGVIIGTGSETSWKGDPFYKRLFYAFIVILMGFGFYYVVKLIGSLFV